MSGEEKSPAPAATKRSGRAPFTVTDALRADVRSRRAAGADVEAIASALGVSVPTLRKYFRAELAKPAPEAPASLFDGAAPAAAPAPKPRAGRKPAGGRPERLPTWDERQRVALLVAANVTQGDICRVLKCSEPWLRANFAEELATGAAVKRAELLDATWRAAKKGNAGAIRLLQERFDRAELERLDAAGNRQAGNRPPAPAPDQKPEPLGKKAQADADADALVSNPDVAALFAPARAPRTH